MKKLIIHLPLMAALFAMSALSFAESSPTQPDTGAATPQGSQPQGSQPQGGSPTAGSQGQQQLVIQTTSNAMGTFLVDSQGRAIYMYSADSQGKSNCNGECAKAWPPIIISEQHMPQAVGIASSNMLSTITRDDGSKQLAFNGMPLYYFIKDQKPGDTKGQGIKDDKGVWYLVKADGTPLTETAGAGSSQPGASQPGAQPGAPQPEASQPAGQQPSGSQPAPQQPSGQ